MGGKLRGASEETGAKGSSGHPTSLPRPADHLYCAYETRNLESNHTAQNGKAAGTDDIPAEALKVDMDIGYIRGDAIPALHEDLGEK